MSVVASLIQNGRVHMAADSAMSDDSMIHVAREPKIFAWKNYLFGVTGSIRVLNIVHALFEPPGNTRGDDYFYVVSDLTGALRKLFDREGVELEGDASADSSKHDFSMLIGYKGRVFVVDDSFQVTEPVSYYFAIGGGADYAMGALEVLSPFRWPAETKLKRAIDSACAWSTACRGPVVFETL